MRDIFSYRSSAFHPASDLFSMERKKNESKTNKKMCLKNSLIVYTINIIRIVKYA